MWKHVVVALVGALALTPALAPALPARADDTLRWFADCTGRLSAEMEHRWLISAPGADLTQGQRDAMWSLVQAMAPPDATAQVMGWRIQAKAAQAALLAQASFSADEVVSTRAKKRAETLVSQCTMALMG